MADRTKVLIMGAAGRDFHNFNTYFRDRQEYEIVAFTATQIPYINDRKYPAELAGPYYPDGIPIHDESEMPELVKKHGVEVVVFAYSDVPYEYVMHRSALVNSLGADFMLMGPDKVMVKSTKPVIAVCAVRTGAGKSQTTRKIQTMLREAGKKVVSPSVTPCPTATSSPSACSGTRPSTTSRSTSAPSRRWRSTSRTSWPAT